MKRMLIVAVLTGAITLAAAPFARAADGYRIAWWTVDGGGGTLSGPGFVMQSTAGQPDAGTAAGGPFVLRSGYWDAAALPTQYFPFTTLRAPGE
jgi:hypothetical protein